MATSYRSLPSLNFFPDATFCDNLRHRGPEAGAATFFPGGTFWDILGQCSPDPVGAAVSIQLILRCAQKRKRCVMKSRRAVGSRCPTRFEGEESVSVGPGLRIWVAPAGSEICCHDRHPDRQSPIMCLMLNKPKPRVSSRIPA